MNGYPDESIHNNVYDTAQAPVKKKKKKRKWYIWIPLLILLLLVGYYAGTMINMKIHPSVLPGSPPWFYKLCVLGEWEGESYFVKGRDWPIHFDETEPAECIFRLKTNGTCTLDCDKLGIHESFRYTYDEISFMSVFFKVEGADNLQLKYLPNFDEVIILFEDGPVTSIVFTHDALIKTVINE